ncbi:MAG: T9SS type A sorting domain-containing protein [Bacteroidia bacterium]
MKKRFYFFKLSFAMVFFTASAFAGLDWTYGSLNNPDNFHRYSTAVAYASTNVFVSGTEENSSGSTLIVTKKLSSTGTLSVSKTNTYVIPAGTVVHDFALSIALDASGNVYVLGSQFGSAARGQDIVLIKYNSSLSQQWKKLIYNTASTTTNFDDKPSKLLIDAGGNIYVAGSWSKPTLFGVQEIVVRKYDGAGALLFSRPVPQASGTVMGDATDMCIDNSLNITVCATSETAAGVKSIMYARISNTGSLTWKKFYASPATYTFIGKPQIETTAGGTVYFASSLDRAPVPNNHFARHMVVKLNSTGTKVWEKMTAEFNLWADNIALRIDANGNIYTGSDFAGPASGGYEKHRMYKRNSAGTLLWSYISPETSSFFRFETYAGSALFIISQKTNPVNPVLRKLDAATGNILWTENISYTTPPNYVNLYLSPSAIAVKASSSEVAYCGNMHAEIITPAGQEYRWMVKKYGATTPRLTDEADPASNKKTETSIHVFPNPANDKINITVEGFEYADREIIISGISGKIILQQTLLPADKNISLETQQLSPGLYTILIKSNAAISITKFLVAH